MKLSKQVLAVAMCFGMLYGWACNAQAWFQIAAGLVPIMLQTVGTLQTGNGGWSPATASELKQYSDLATSILNDVSADIKTAQTTPGVIPKIDAELAQLQKQTQTLIPQFTNDPKVLAWANAIYADVVDLVNLVPIVQQATGHARAMTMRVSLPTAKQYEAVFQHRLQAAQAAQ